MRLCNAETLRLEGFRDDVTPPYAIVSHTWAREEVLYEDFSDGPFQNSVTKKEAGYEKLLLIRRVTRSHSLNYFWVDTCTIDRSSNIEPNESIKSMFRWFQRSKICIVHLADVTGLDESFPNDLSKVAMFCSSRWFKRSWPLQELLAPDPEKQLFYSSDWKYLGSKLSLSSIISEATGIATDVLEKRRDLQKVTFAERISWSVGRGASLLQDHVYSLAGVFNIQMAFDFGEGELAFMRFRQQILKDFEDYTVLFCTKKWADRIYQLREYPNTKTAFDLVLPDIIMHSPVDLLSQQWVTLPPHIGAPDPPELTTRGLRMNLLCKRVQSFLVAWTYCTLVVEMVEYAVCVKVVPSAAVAKSNRPPLRARLGDEIYFVTLDRLVGFELNEVYFSLSGEAVAWGILEHV